MPATGANNHRLYSLSPCMDILSCCLLFMREIKGNKKGGGRASMFVAFSVKFLTVHVP